MVTSAPAATTPMVICRDWYPCPEASEAVSTARPELSPYTVTEVAAAPVPIVTVLGFAFAMVVSVDAHGQRHGRRGCDREPDRDVAAVADGGRVERPLQQPGRRGADDHACRIEQRVRALHHARHDVGDRKSTRLNSSHP